MEAIISIAIPEFNSLADRKIKFTQKENAEETFKSILTSLNKKDSKK